jgi:light-regulated signal transduction histidine kinase (bacteriophytochrome)
VVKYNASTFICSRLGSKIIIFVFILIILVITSFIIFSYYLSQMTYVGNSPIPGTGLGLFISKSIIVMHGGKIWATNNKEKDKGVGSTFTFSLPVKQE